MLRRIVRLTPRFAGARGRLASHRTPAAQALAATIARLLTSELPTLVDAETMAPPVRRYWFRRVPGHNLWVLFTFDDAQVVLCGLKDNPPVPLD